MVMYMWTQQETIYPFHTCFKLLHLYKHGVFCQFSRLHCDN